MSGQIKSFRPLLAVIVLFAFVGTAYPAVVADWRLDQIDGVGPFTTPDSGPNSYTGTISGNAVAVYTPGVIDDALSFGGSNDYVDLGDIDLFTNETGKFPDGSFNVSIWFNRAINNTGTGTDTNHLVHNVLLAQSSNSHNDNFELGTESNEVELYIDSGGGSEDATVTATVGNGGIGNNRWHQVVVAYDTTISDDTAFVYFDGRLLAAFNQFEGVLAASDGSRASLAVARPDNQKWGDFGGKMDNVVIRNDALSADAVAADYNQAIGITNSGFTAARINLDAGLDTAGDSVWEDAAHLMSLTTSDTDLTLSNIVTTPTSVSGNPEVTAAYVFNGTNSSALFGKSFDALTGNPTNNNSSFEMYFKPDDLSGQEVLYETGGSGDGLSLTLNNAIVQFVAKNSGVSAGASIDLSSVVVGPDGFFHLLATVNLDDDYVVLWIGEAGAAYGGTAGGNLADWAGSDAAGLGSMQGSAVGGSGGTFGGLNGYGAFDGQIGIFRFYEYALLVPEPSTFAMLLGLAGVGLLAWFRRRRG